VNASAAELERFCTALRALPAPIVLTHLDARTITSRRFAAFTIRESGGKLPQPVVPADLGVCPDCLAEMLNPGNRRWHYPYISCAQCGPRYTIMQALPYDRERTTMSEFTMCQACQQEYANIDDRRCYGQTLSCRDCGPQLAGLVRGRTELLAPTAALAAARELLASGKIIAVKSVGGFNLVCRADAETAVQALRQLKHRPTKPLAVLVRDLESARQICTVTPAEAELLQSPARPIVLLARKNLEAATLKMQPATKPGPAQNAAEPAVTIARSVAYPYGRLGVFLPPQGLYALLAEHFPLVVTSCNESGAPIIFREASLEKYYAAHPQVAGLFTYARAILRPADDSVVQVVAGRTQILRRTRGYLPEPVAITPASGARLAARVTLNKETAASTSGVREKSAAPAPIAPVVLAVGAQMEPSFALGRESLIYPLAVPGHLEEVATQQHWDWLVQDSEKLLGLTPQRVVADLHPDYVTTTWAQSSGLPVLQVQHHHAHALSVLAEHQVQGPVLAVCFDGTGWGSDGTVWGGEFLHCEGLSFRRVAHLAAVPMLGGNQSMRQGWKTALCQLVHAGLTPAAFPEAVPQMTAANFTAVRAALHQQVNVIKNSSLGRLFDAVSALLGICSDNTHQGRGAMELEAWAQLARTQKIAPLALHLANRGEIFDAAALLQELAESRKQVETGAEKQWRAAAALGFHRAVIDMVLAVAQKSNCRQVALTGGCFANRILLAGCEQSLKSAGFRVYFNEQVPPGDGGIALGQAYYGLLYAAREQGGQ
jgi:hydrogenase maturation protein HypF